MSYPTSRTIVIASALAAIIASGGAFAETATIGTTAKGKAFVDSKGMTLYTFDKDSAGKSACNGPCATNWPPLFAAANEKPGANMSIVTRADGKKMWAYKDKPLYTFAKDTKPGEAKGDGLLNGAWHVAKP